MSTHKHIDRIALLIILTVLAGVLILFAGMGASGERTGMEKEYETGLFSTDQVHTIEITMDDWEGDVYKRQRHHRPPGLAGQRGSEGIFPVSGH